VSLDGTERPIFFLASQMSRYNQHMSRYVCSREAILLIDLTRSYIFPTSWKFYKSEPLIRADRRRNPLEWKFRRYSPISVGDPANQKEVKVVGRLKDSDNETGKRGKMLGPLLLFWLVAVCLCLPVCNNCRCVAAYLLATCPRGRPLFLQ